MQVGTMINASGVLGLFVLGVALLRLVRSGGSPPDQPIDRRGGQVAPIQSPRPGVGAVRSWGYQLQDLDIEQSAASPFDLLVVDASKDGSAARQLTSAEVARLQRKADGSRRLVLAYASIGEAESYRPYWDETWKTSPPEWLLHENCDWAGNYAVRFWHREWQRLMYGTDGAYLDRIQQQGFDGIYIDKCDVFEDLRTHAPGIAAARPQMEEDMVAFVRGISRHLKSRDRSFLVVMQNAEALLGHAGLMAAIDAVAKEELIYGVDGTERPNDAEEIKWSRSSLDRARLAGKPVLVVEYLGTQDKVVRAARLTRDFGYVLYVAPRDRQLDRLSFDVRET